MNEPSVDIAIGNQWHTVEQHHRPQSTMPDATLINRRKAPTELTGKLGRSAPTPARAQAGG